MNSDESDLAVDVFRCISDHLSARCTDLAEIVATGYSFEEWLNWESFLACRRRSWHVVPRPGYSGLGMVDSKELGDLLIRPAQSERGVVVETATMHDWTASKWIDKVDRDSHKLKRLSESGQTGLQIVVVTSKNAIAGKDSWERFLSRISVWSAPESFTSSCVIGECGQALIRGWVYPGVVSSPIV